MNTIATFSLVARDPETGDLGVAVASKFLAVGAVVPWLEAGVGAVATQSYANPRFGPQGLALMRAGAGMEEVLATFRRTDADLETRQFGLVNALGESLSFTGAKCHAWAGGRSGPNWAAQGNILAGPGVVEALVETFLGREDLPLPERLTACLLAADRAGGDRRGRQSAALVVVGVGKGYGGMDRWIDLRVDDHPDPCAELERLLGIHRLLFSKPESPTPLSPEDIAWIQAVLSREGYYPGVVSGVWDEATEQAFTGLIGMENLEERYPGGPYLDPEALAYLKGKFGQPR
ncbi:MAG: fimbrial assembly protein FimA [Meiothermus sp.]